MTSSKGWSVAEEEPKDPLNAEQATMPKDIALSVNPDVVPLADAIYQLWQHWADFEIKILSPSLPILNPHVIHLPELIPNSTDYEFVYPIHDHGDRLLTSKQNELFSSGKSMCKLYYTIEKMIAILVQRLEHEHVGTDQEIQVAFDGHELPQRKGFEVIINLKQNLVVTNFIPGAWGEYYLRAVKNLSDRGYGYPTQSPRDIYKRSRSSVGIKPK